MNKKDAIAQISALTTDAVSKLREAEKLAKDNEVPFNFQLATLAGKTLYNNPDGYEYPDNEPAVVGTDGFDNYGWSSSGLYC